MRWVLPQAAPSDCKDWFEPTAMKPEERTRMNWLCVLIQDEKDPEVFDQLVDELAELLEGNRRRLCQRLQMKLN
jgi:hypothetical protein